ncbi:uncharacterized protein THITE_2119080 [Thermothielavioides terrestris NRRL 8126]|uniref:Uncharacterized protein n=1 Tax=Thermothielavioides terrestris (strain ATCC 38088 / NRRL 8126) TaxID=578455 RepID=G2RBA5_THETT|nr:uncharacterized protein THITE_2119080 [Thermothielavioides terrestris NRRL 8126]AEO69076.1 hypothetical protein THITE_2119080 [Thermothielavioides terrestris NRRL 8126]
MREIDSAVLLFVQGQFRLVRLQSVGCAAHASQPNGLPHLEPGFTSPTNDWQP